jgi:hypothetical protein
MTVKELIKKLSKCSEDAEVLIPNDLVYLDGLYYVTNIEEYDDGTIVIDTDYEKRDEEENEE